MLFYVKVPQTKPATVLQNFELKRSGDRTRRRFDAGSLLFVFIILSPNIPGQ